MNLAQLINTERKSSFKGIIAYADAASAVSMQVVTNYMTNQLINSLLKLLDLKHTTDDNKELQQGQQKKTNMIWKVVSYPFNQR